ncbi:MAG: pirin family protein [Flavobacteriales bacterium]|nr:pirin family protein [Flavobacteriales bacterium]
MISNDIDELKPLEIIGFNHLPNATTEKMNQNIIIHRADTRGGADHGWLKAKHSFSFANYYNPERMHFGVLRVLNDDTIAPGMGFGTHPHDNMEIITIPLEGAVAHKDSMGNSGVIQAGEVQVMSAGTGIYHSEFNHNKDADLKLFQIWLFPDRSNVEPRYDQYVLPELKNNEWLQVLSPDKNDAGVWIYQQAWFNMGKLTAGTTLGYAMHKPVENGLYIMVVDGVVEIEGNELRKRDAMGIWSINQVDVKATSDARLLLMEVPMALPG